MDRGLKGLRERNRDIRGGGNLGPALLAELGIRAVVKLTFLAFHGPSCLPADEPKIFIYAKRVKSKNPGSGHLRASENSSPSGTSNTTMNKTEKT
jgi:hypothetical protein